MVHLLYEISAVKNVKPSKFKNHQSSQSACSSLQTEIVRQVQFNTFA